MIHQMRETHYYLSDFVDETLGKHTGKIMKENTTRKWTFVKCNRTLKTSPTTPRHPITDNKMVNFWGVVQDVQPGYQRMKRI